MNDEKERISEEEAGELVPLEEPRKLGRPKGVKDSYPRPSRRDEKWDGNDGQTPEVTRQYLQFIRYVSGQPPLDISDVKQVQARLDWYFDQCEDEGMKPTVTGMCNALGVDRQTLLRWEKGEHREGTHQALIVKYKKMLEEFWELQMINGKINPVTGIFLGKNHFGYADKQEIELAPKDPLSEIPSREEIEARYRDSIAPPDEDESVSWESY